MTSLQGLGQPELLPVPGQDTGPEAGLAFYAAGEAFLE
jgi:hypothetical protein